MVYECKPRIVYGIYSSEILAWKYLVGNVTRRLKGVRKEECLWKGFGDFLCYFFVQIERVMHKMKSKKIVDFEIQNNDYVYTKKMETDDFFTDLTL